LELAQALQAVQMLQAAMAHLQFSTPTLLLVEVVEVVSKTQEVAEWPQTQVDRAEAVCTEHPGPILAMVQPVKVILAGQSIPVT
jgi:hypothetical protein